MERHPFIGWLLVSTALFLGFIGGAFLLQTPCETRIVPVVQNQQCPEDAVIVGQGDYTNGQWTTYQCIARDDL